MAQPVSDRDPEQVARERAAAEVSAVLLYLDHTLARRAQKTLRKDAPTPTPSSPSPTRSRTCHLPSTDGPPRC